MLVNTEPGLDELDGLELLGSELDAAPAVEVFLPDKPALNIPHPVKQQLRTRSAVQVISHQEKRSEQITEFCQRRKISDICHFTRIENLKGIISEGLLPRAVLEKRFAVTLPIFTDEFRFDRQKNASCLSLSFPNYKMFYHKRRQSGDDNLWVVIIYDYSAITRLNCAFTTQNAAASVNLNSDVASRNTVESLEELFGDFGSIQRKDLRLPDNYPTNPQAEVLAYEIIPAKYVKKVVFFTQRQAEQWLSENRSIYPLNNYSYNGGMFKYRMDFAFWKKEML